MLKRSALARAGGFVVLLAVSAFAAAGAITGSGTEAASLDGAALKDIVARATAYEHGEGVARDPDKAASLYCEAARAGDVEATFALGWMYANGRGIGRNESFAGTLFARAARSGHAQAQRLVDFVGGDREALPPCMTESTIATITNAEADAGWGVDPDFVLDPYASLPPEKRKIVDLVNREAPRYAIDPRLALAVIATESNFEPRAQSDKGAQGLMQLIPETAARFKVRKPFDAADNVRGGMQYLRWLLAYYRGQVALAAAAYNAGEGAVDRYGGVPPYPETRDYVRRVLRLFQGEHHPYDAKVTEPSRAIASGR